MTQTVEYGNPEDRRRRQPTAEQLSLFPELSPPLKAPAERAGVEGEDATHLRDLSTLYDLSGRLLSARGLEGVLKSILACATGEGIGFRRAGVYLLDPKDRSTLESRFELKNGKISEIEGGARIPVSQEGDAAAWVARNNRPLYTRRASEDERVNRGWIEAEEFVMVPLNAGNDFVGVLWADNLDKKPITSTNIQTLLTFANQAGMALHNAQLLDELEHRMGRELMLLRLASSDIYSLEMETALESVCAKAADLTGADMVDLRLRPKGVRDPSDVRIHLHGFGDDEQRMLDYVKDVRERREIRPLVQEMIETRRQVYIDVERELEGSASERRVDAELMRDLHMTRGSILTIPVLDERGALVGDMRIYSQSRQEYSPDLVDSLTTLAYNAATSINNARAFGDLNKAHATLRDFIDDASHEFRNPLSTAGGFARMIGGDLRKLADRLSRGEEIPREELEPHLREQSERTGVIVERVARMEELVNGMTDLAYLEKAAFRLEDVISGALVETAVESNRPKAEKKGVRLDCHIPEEPPTAHVDRRWMTQAVSNIIDNAIKFTPEGGEVDVRLKSGREDFRVEVGVRDTGIGIPEDQLGRIFEPLHRVDATATAQPGAGLGLTIANKIVRKHGGEIHVESAVGGGSTFTIVIPTQ